MQALGGHAKSSRQPPLKERKSAKADESAAKQDVIDETILENGATHDSAAAVIVDDVTPQTVVHENGNGAVAEITSDEEAAVLATVAAVLAKIEPQPATADDSATRPEAVQEDDDTAPRNAPSFTSGKTGRRYIRMSWMIRMSRNIFSGIWRRKKLAFWILFPTTSRKRCLGCFSETRENFDAL